MAAKGYRPALIGGYLLMAAGLLGLNSDSHHLALASIAACGCGVGLVIPGTNLYVGEISGSRRSTALSLLNLAWGAGAVLCPILFLAAERRDRVGGVLGLFAVVSLVFAVILRLLPFLSPRWSDSSQRAENSRARFPLHIPVALGLLFFIYIGTEGSISGWAAEHAKRLGDVEGALWRLAPTFFWAGLLIGRGLVSLLLLRFQENYLVLGGLVLAATGTAFLLKASSPGVVGASVALTVLGLSGSYPIFIAWLSKWYGERARRVGGIMFALAALGGAIVPWSVGYVSKHSSGLRVGLLVPFAGCFVMLVLVLVLRRRVAS